MPPEASSRSRTYFPKSWGNTRFRHATAAGLGVACFACTDVPGEEEVGEIRPHYLPYCGPRTGEPADIDLEALGDFDPSAETREIVGDGEGRVALRIPPDTSVVTARARAGASAWSGVGVLGSAGDVDLALFPVGAACTLADGEEGGYPGPLGGEATGYHPASRLLLVAGGNGPSAIATGALAFDVSTGRVERIRAEGALRARRAMASVTVFGDALLVSGGLDPAGVPIGTADVFQPAERSFEEELLALESPRGRHAAVELSSGDTLLVGGVGPLGTPLDTLEVIVKATRRYRISGLSDLATPRIDPVALRLTDDRILVAGGLDAASAPVDSVEWLLPDASRASRLPVTLGAAESPTLGRAFVAMPGGGFLAAGGCRLLPAGAVPDCAVSCGNDRHRGCPSDEVLWISPEGSVDALPSLDSAVAEPRLVAGEGGRPFLGVDPGSGPPLRRFDPWRGRFVVPEGDSPRVPAGARFVSIDAGLFVWVESDGPGGLLRAFRHGTRTPFSAAVAPLLLSGTVGTSPDRAPGAAIGLDTSPLGGAVLTAPGASLVVTDTTYADVFVTVEVAGEALPIVRLGEQAFGTADCPWPGPGPSAGLEREGASVTLRVGGATRTCAGPRGRATIRVENPDTAPTGVHLLSLTVRRSAPP